MQKATVKWAGDQRFEAVGPSGHALLLDSDRDSNAGPGPMELLIVALGACTATDIVIILEKQRQTLQSLEVMCFGERAADPPRVWTKLEIVFYLRGELEKTAVERAVQLSAEKYCSVAAILKCSAALSWRYEILPPL